MFTLIGCMEFCEDEPRDHGDCWGYKVRCLDTGKAGVFEPNSSVIQEAIDKWLRAGIKRLVVEMCGRVVRIGRIMESSV